MGVLLAFVLGTISFYYFIKPIKAFQAFSWQGAIKKTASCVRQDLSIYTTKMPCVLRWWNVFVCFIHAMWIIFETIITMQQRLINFQSVRLCFLENESDLWYECLVTWVTVFSHGDYGWSDTLTSRGLFKKCSPSNNICREFHFLGYHVSL